MNNRDINQEDRIDVSALKYMIVGFARLFFKSISFLGLLLRKRLLIIIAGLLIGIGAAFLRYEKSTTFYKASMLAASPKMKGQACAGIVLQLDELRKEGTDMLSRELAISQNAAAAVLGFRAETIRGDSLVRDTTLNLPFRIVIPMTDPSFRDTLQNAILYYFNQLPQVKKLIAADDSSYAAVLRSLENKPDMQGSLDPRSGVPLLVEARRKLLAENQGLLLIDPIKYSTVAGTDPKKAMIKFGCIGLFAGLCLASLLEIRKRVVL